MLPEVLRAHGPIPERVREQHGGPASDPGHAEVPASTFHSRTFTKAFRLFQERSLRGTTSKFNFNTMLLTFKHFFTEFSIKIHRKLFS